MNTSQHTAHKAGRSDAEQAAREGAAGAVAMMGMVLRVAGPVAVRVDMRFAGTPERQLGLSLGPVLVYMRSHFVAARIARQWAAAAPLVAPLPTVLAGRKREVMAPTGPWSTAVMVRLNGVPNVTGGVIEPQAGTEASRMLRMRVGPLVWEVCDAEAYAALLRGWKLAEQMLSVDSDDL
ncbi:hypothetical protein [Pseudonocardia sp. HH130630-07]|uniref:hypothetical protein n=1 Tax=Pseudonocardia sp. HH130630-07 TaxID=1690815 RepID=UPI000814E71A|nr:hypothetical protein [Pseudonocardia sp. HH130630-07]ANY06929.1 hypothetical protein AFB00_12220 [Pseudonocardia sp. HH130630-07]